MSLESYIDNLIANDLDCNHWFMTKQTMSDYYFPFFIASIVESYPTKRTAEQNFARYYSHVFKNNNETKILYPAQSESENTYRNAIVAEFLGLIRNDDRRYATAQVTPAYSVLKKYIKKHDDVGTYRELVDHQIEKICLNVVPSNKFEQVRSVTLFPVIFLYKILIELQKKYNDSKLDYNEFAAFVMRSKTYSDWRLVLELIEQYRNKSYDRAYDEKIEQILEHESTKNVRFNALFGSLSHLDYVSWDSYRIKSSNDSYKYVEKIVQMYENSEIYHIDDKNDLYEFMCSDKFFEGDLDTGYKDSSNASWVEFYKEFASKLLSFKDHRDLLIQCIKDVYQDVNIKLPTLEKDNDIVDIDPFTVFALFNKGITKENRVKIITGFKKVFDIQAPIPDDFDGIPVVNNLSATFYYFKDDREPNDIQNIWNLFETALAYAEDKNETIKEEFIKRYDIVLSQKGISWNLTMGLFWSRPYNYINLDSCMREAFKNDELIPPVDGLISALIKKPPTGQQYLEIIEKCNEVFETHPNLNFVILSIMAWEKSLGKDKAGEKNMNSTNIAKNTILYGPPGTGKTYNTVCYAVAIVEDRLLEDVLDEEYTDVFNRYNTYKNEGLIEFVTFHQSYGYEEFIEGIKPVTESLEDEELADIKYADTDGVFKAFCNRADSPILENQKDFLGLNNNPTIWKVSLEGTGNNATRSECMENGHIRIGFDSYGENITDDTIFEYGGKKVLNAFISRMKIGDIIFSCYSATTIDAIGIVTSDYEWHDEYEHYKRVRKVNWIAKNISVNIVDINNGANMTLSSVYRLKNISLADAMVIIKQNIPATIHADKKKNYVFIIDEINRGNISKIFGELITLIEPSKRIGAEEGIKAILPYSKKPFGIPDNVYILGTMNTADRSIAVLDTALRRRFNFVEMLPDTEILKDVVVDGIEIDKMLNKINERISVLFDREHTIGHAYFICLKDKMTIETLSNIFKNKVIPLLQEYFYEDYERIRLVLADNQVEDTDEQFVIAKNVDLHALFGSSDVDILDDIKCYEINNVSFNNKEAYIKIYK